jgi:hypothetical protein
MAQGIFCLPAHVILLRDHCHNFVTSKRIRLRLFLSLWALCVHRRSRIHHAGDCLDSVALTAAISTLFNARTTLYVLSIKERLRSAAREHRDYFNFGPALAVGALP